MRNIRLTPESIAMEYSYGTDYKNSIGRRGIAEQSKINERFFVGDQWHGASCGTDKPLVRRNVIKRIGEYKMAAISAKPVTVNFVADGVPGVGFEEKKLVKNRLLQGNLFKDNITNAEVSVITSAMSDYQRVTAERVKFNSKMEQLLKNAYISGTGICYTYWDSLIETGLYADAEKNIPIKGDIAFEVLDVENVVFGDPNCDDVQAQPYIIIAVRREIGEVIREAKRNRIPEDMIANIKPDENYYYNSAGDRGETEPNDSRRVTVYTKLYKEWDKDLNSYKVMAVKATKGAYIRKPWDMKLRLYPIAKMSWERRRSSIYGDSEITNMIPNQIAINRALTAAVWSAMATGMPITVVNGDIVDGKVTNNPGQVIKVFGSAEETASAVRYINPPNYAIALNKAVEDLASFTLSDSGANDAALGNVRPDNAAAIIQMREAAMAPLQIYMNRYYETCEDIARIWADYWLNLYGNRSLKIEDSEGIHYIPFNGERYKSLVINARIDVGESTLWSESVVISTLDNLLERQLITFEQYLDRIPGGLIPNVTGLKADLQKAAQMQQDPRELSEEEAKKVSMEVGSK